MTDAATAATTTDDLGGTQRRPSRLHRFVRGNESDSPWVRPALITLLGLTAVLYLWDLSNNGWGNDFYSAAVQAGSKSWKAFFFGSSDAANTITVDKPPASFWPAELSVRIFGLSSWSLLVPQALMGVAAVGCVYAAVRRWFTAGAGLIAGLVLALTPVATLMFRFNNPDALLILLMVFAAYAALRAVEEDRLRWYLLCGAAVGFGFLTKQLQVALVVPGFALALLVAGRSTIWRRIRGLLIAGAAMIVSAGWWVTIVQLWPASSRPYIGGTKHNSFLELTFGYNGFGRLTGNEGGMPGGGGGPLGGKNLFGGKSPIGGAGGIGSIFGGSRGITRLFNGVVGGQISWLLPAALIALVAGLVWCGKRSRMDMARASFIVWGGWLLVTGIVFSYMSGIFHEYYTVALAPGIAALVGIGVSIVWSSRQRWWTWAVLAVAIALTSWWATVLIDRSRPWGSWLTPMVVAIGTLAALVAVFCAVRAARGAAPSDLLGGVAIGLALVGALVGPLAWSLQTVSTSRGGAIVTAGPAARGIGGGGGFPGGKLPSGASGFPGGKLPGGASGFPGGKLPGGASGFPGGKLPGGAGTGRSIPGFGSSAAPSKAVLKLLMVNADRYTWIAATTGATAAAPYQLATQHPVMPIGGFSGSDPAPTLSQFKEDVTRKKVHYFIGGMGVLGGLSGSGGNQSITSWVAQHYSAFTVGGVTLYDLTVPRRAG
jgi:4-amino-4-deoxy-L-arabinose transferase-like glycosyltransferase